MWERVGAVEPDIPGSAMLPLQTWTSMGVSVKKQLPHGATKLLLYMEV